MSYVRTIWFVTFLLQAFWLGAAEAGPKPADETIGYDVAQGEEEGVELFWSMEPGYYPYRPDRRDSRWQAAQDRDDTGRDQGRSDLRADSGLASRGARPYRCLARNRRASRYLSVLRREHDLLPADRQGD